jgi:hypothetical protein
MKRILLAALVLSLNFAFASAQETCESKAVSKDGKPLAGAAKSSFLKKCKRDSCLAKAVGSEGKALAGAAKRSFMQKCQREA